MEFIKKRNMKSISRHLTGAFVMATILLAALPSFLSCNKNGTDFTDGHSELTKVSDMLYEVTYSDYSAEAPNNSYFDIAGDLAC